MVTATLVLFSFLCKGRERMTVQNQCATFQRLIPIQQPDKISTLPRAFPSFPRTFPTFPRTFSRLFLCSTSGRDQRDIITIKLLKDWFVFSFLRVLSFVRERAGGYCHDNQGRFLTRFLVDLFCTGEGRRIAMAGGDIDWAFGSPLL